MRVLGENPEGRLGKNRELKEIECFRIFFLFSHNILDYALMFMAKES